MSRVFFVLFLLVAAVALGAGALFALSYGGDTLPARAVLPALAEPASVQLYAEGRPPLLRAASEEDALRALGYAQATTLTWPLLVARQAARADLAPWMGREALRLDRHAVRLGLLADARRALHTLDAPDREALQAFADGVTAGLRDARTRDRFVGLSGVAPPDSFTVLDVLGIEQLFGWTATQIALPDSAVLPAVADSFLATDSLFRRTIGLDGWAESAAWSFSDSATSALTVRYETGQSALPALFEALIVVGQDTTFAAFVPGTPFPLAVSAARASVVVPRAAASLGPAAPGAWQRHEVPLRTGHGGVLPAVAFRRSTEVLLAADTSDAAPWSLRFDAARGATDAAAWLALLRSGSSSAASFALLPGSTMLVATPEGSTHSGPATAYRAGYVTGETAAMPFLQARLDTLARRHASAPHEWYRDAVSPWGLRVRDELLARIDTALFTSPVQHTAFEYLRNWSGSFRETSIGATIFDVVARQLGLDPTHSQALADTTQPFVRAQYSARFAAATDTLVARHGADPLDWRWELLHPDTRAFPLWSAQPALPLSFGTPAVVTPFTLPGAGHPTTLRGGTAGPDATRATHVIVVEPGDPLATLLFRLHLAPTRAFARYRVEGHPYPARTLRVLPEPSHTIALLPGTR